jgi:hypothetical protein
MISTGRFSIMVVFELIMRIGPLAGPSACRAATVSMASVEIVPRGYLQISFLQPLRERQRSKGISRSKTLVVIV